ncbi:MAG: sn-glycerol-3-phosphate ABC transporter ATP-binding protein UgpC [Ectothiorhodospiraceae bacterium]|jgi:ABC-type sugar transport system ATPase subunit
MADVKLRGIRKAFGSVETIHGVDLDIEDGEFVVFVGPSGCGKSTLLRLIAGLETVTSGDLSIGGNTVNRRPPSQRGVAMVFQSYALYPHMSVYENMAFGLKPKQGGKEEVRRKVKSAAALLQLDELLDRLPSQLSGGQRQRVAIGRAIVREPKVFLFDEPLSNLDAALRIQMRMELAKLHFDLKTTMVYVTHDQVEAMTLADKIVVLNEGRVEQAGAPLELYHHPRSIFVATFLGAPQMNLLPAEVAAADAEHVEATLADGTRIRAEVDGAGLQPGASITIGIRPEDMDGKDRSAQGIEGDVVAVEPLGESTLLHIASPALPEGSVIARFDGSQRFRVGERISLRLPSAGCHVFDGDGLSRRRHFNYRQTAKPVHQTG